jgi:hypothetical protein
MFSHESSTRGKEKDRTIKRSAVPLDHPDDQENPGIPRSLPEGLTGWTGHIHGTFIIPSEILTPFWRPGANSGSKVQTCGIG